MVTVEGKALCHLTCKQSKNLEIWVKADNGHEKFYIRMGPSSTELSPRESVAYIRDHFEAK